MTTLYIDSKKVSALNIDGKQVQLGYQEPQYLTIEPMSSATPDADKTQVLLRNDETKSLSGTFEAKLNDGAWTTVSWEDVSHGIDYNLVKACDASKETISFGEKLQIRGLDKWNEAGQYQYQRKMRVISDAGVKVHGKLADSLTPEFRYDTSTPLKLCYFFQGSTGLKDASGLYLGGIKLTGSCFQNMFSGCSSLVSAPQLPALKLEFGCYRNMFAACRALTSAPALPATTLASECYNQMFYNCSSLASIPALPAKKLAYRCYRDMFSNCTSLKGRIDLPAESLPNQCYHQMFNSCTKVTELHYPASMQNDSTFKGMKGSPWFGATRATVHYDL